MTWTRERAPKQWAVMVIIDDRLHLLYKWRKTILWTSPALQTHNECNAIMGLVWSWLSGPHLSWPSGPHLSWLSGPHLSWLSGPHLTWLSGPHLTWLSGSHLSWLSGPHLSWLSEPHLSWLSGPHTCQIALLFAQQLACSTSHTLISFFGVAWLMTAMSPTSYMLKFCKK